MTQGAPCGGTWRAAPPNVEPDQHCSQSRSHTTVSRPCRGSGSAPQARQCHTWRSRKSACANLGSVPRSRKPQHRRPAQTNEFERSVQRAPQIAPGCSVQRRRPRLTFGMGSLMDEGGRPCHACHCIVQRAAPAASHASVAMPARGQHERCQHERWALLTQRLAGRGHAGRPVAPDSQKCSEGQYVCW